MFISLFSSLTFAQTYFLQVVVDRTGSMDASRLTGNSRWQDAISLAESDVAQSFADASSNGIELKIAVASFESNSGFVQHLDFGSFFEALTALNSLKNIGTGGATPLADALCTGADNLIDQYTSDKYQMYVAFYTDMGENYSVGECSGSDWMTNVMEKFDNEDGHPILNVTMYVPDDGVTSSTSSLLSPFQIPEIDKQILNEYSAYNELIGAETVNTPIVIQAISDEVEFLKNLATVTGGSAEIYSDTEAEPIFSDDDDDDCVLLVCPTVN